MVKLQWVPFIDGLAMLINSTLYRAVTNRFNPYPTAFPYGNGMVLHFTSNKAAARPKLYTESLTRDLKLMYSRFTLVRIFINL